MSISTYAILKNNFKDEYLCNTLQDFVVLATKFPEKIIWFVKKD